MNQHIQEFVDQAGAQMFSDQVVERFVALLIDDINKEILATQTCDPHTCAPYFTTENQNLRDLVQFFREWYGVVA